jgi:hypothetical protein
MLRLRLSRCSQARGVITVFLLSRKSFYDEELSRSFFSGRTQHFYSRQIISSIVFRTELSSKNCYARKIACHSLSTRQRNSIIFVRFEVFTAVTMKNAFFWDVAPCRYFVNRCFGGTYHLHLQGIRNPRAMNQREQVSADCRLFLYSVC